ncbi:MAG: pyridoxamine 5'-phosphate oxidase family protein [Clostridia bacterium]|nr:pyridoxamine 5'-phosphate oxidase family protein [Clostridia bacterium]
MFRQVVRTKQALSEDEAKYILSNTLRGVLATHGDDGYPYAMPLNHFYSEKDNRLYFHSGKTGHKLDALLKDNKVSYCVFNDGEQLDGNWYLTFKSVIVFGKVGYIQDKEELYAIARDLSHKFTKDDSYIEHEIEKSGPKTLMFYIDIEHITGKLVNER